MLVHLKRLASSWGLGQSGKGKRHSTTVRIVTKGESVFENLIQENRGTKNLRSGHDQILRGEYMWVARVEIDLDVSSTPEAVFSLPISNPFSHQALLLQTHANDEE